MGYHYNKATHLYFALCNIHGFGYFLYDTIIEIYFGCDDFVVNAHHVVVLTTALGVCRSEYGGFEFTSKTFQLDDVFIVGYLLAELSGPFLMMRSILPTIVQKGSLLITINDGLFAFFFILNRIVLAPILIIPFYEADNVLYQLKVSISLLVLISSFWMYQILYSISELVSGPTPGGPIKKFFKAMTEHKPT